MMSHRSTHFRPTNINLFNDPPCHGSFNMYPNTLQEPKAPFITGTSVLGVKFNGGVAIAADILASRRFCARFRNCPRIMKVNDNIILGAGGDYADYQYIRRNIETKVITDLCLDDGFLMKPKSFHSWLTTLLYGRRTMLNPLWNSIVVGGLQDGETYLGAVDKLGTAYVDDSIATGYGAYIARPLIRDAIGKAPPEGLSEEDARKLLVDCLRILLYRDARSFPKYHIAVLTSGGVTLEGPLNLDTNWEVALMV